MRRAFTFALLFAAVLAGASLFFVGLGFAADHVSAAMPQIQQGLQTAASAQTTLQQGQNINPCSAMTGTGGGTDVANMGACIGWIFDHYKLQDIWNAIYNAGYQICVTLPGPPVHHNQPPVINPTPPCPSCANGQPGGDAP